MSYPVMPPMPMSMSSGLKKTPRFNTLKQKTVAGLTSAVALMPYPVWDFEFSMDNILGSERLGVVSQFFGTYLAACGGANLFLFTDPQDCTVNVSQFGTGDGTTVSFQLSRNVHGSVDIIQSVNGTPKIYIAGTLTTPTSISNTGVVTFATPPALNAALTWSGGFYYACRFAEDSIDSTRSYTVNNGIDQWMFGGIKFSSEFVPTSTYGKIAAPGGV